MECSRPDAPRTGSPAGLPEVGLWVSGEGNGSDGNEPGGRNRNTGSEDAQEERDEEAAINDEEAEGSDVRATLLQVFEELDPEEQKELMELVIQILGGPGANKK